MNSIVEKQPRGSYQNADRFAPRVKWSNYFIFSEIEIIFRINIVNKILYEQLAEL